MITSGLLWLLPSEVAPHVATLLIVLCGIAIMLNMFRAAIWLAVFALLLLAIPLIEPAVEAFVDAALDQGIAWAEQLPWWITAIALCILALMVLRVVLSLFLGKRAAAHAVGTLAAAAIIGCILFVIRTPFRLVGFMLGPRNR
jgi:hypothetical protein